MEANLESWRKLMDYSLGNAEKDFDKRKVFKKN